MITDQFAVSSVRVEVSEGYVLLRIERFGVTLAGAVALKPEHAMALAKDMIDAARSITAGG